MVEVEERSLNLTSNLALYMQTMIIFLYKNLLQLMWKMDITNVDLNEGEICWKLPQQIVRTTTSDRGDNHKGSCLRRSASPI